LLGQGQLEQTTFSGSFERLRLRLPPIPGVRTIAPPVAFGDETILIEATRTLDVARRFPLEASHTVQVGVRRIHALVHPGLSFLILTDGSDASQTALTVGGRIARLAHARVTILSYGLAADTQQRHLQEAKEKLGSGLASLEVHATPDSPTAAIAREVESQAYDLVILGSGGLPTSETVSLAENILSAGDHHLLIVPGPHSEPTHALICVTGGEPGKEDVLFAGRFLRRLGAQATLLSILSTAGESKLRDRTQRFLSSDVRTLEVLGVSAQAAIRVGNVRDEIAEQMKAGGHDLLVLGAPLTQRGGEASLVGLVGQILGEMTAHPVLIIHSHYAAVNTRPLTHGRLTIVEEIIP